MKKQWVSMDGWRGYFKPVPQAGYELLLDCSVVNETGDQLKKIVVTWLRDKHIHYQTGYLRSSNVFSSRFYIVVEAKRIPEDLREAIENWFIGENNSTFSVFSGESWDLDVTKAKDAFDTALGIGKYTLL